MFVQSQKICERSAFIIPNSLQECCCTASRLLFTLGVTKKRVKFPHTSEFVDEHYVSHIWYLSSCYLNTNRRYFVWRVCKCCRNILYMGNKTLYNCSTRPTTERAERELLKNVIISTGLCELRVFCFLTWTKRHSDVLRQHYTYTGQHWSPLRVLLLPLTLTYASQLFLEGLSHGSNSLSSNQKLAFPH